MLSKEQLYRVIDLVTTAAQGYATKVLIQGNAGALTRFANSEIHQNVFEDITTVTITITEGKKVSQISTNSYDEAELRTATLEAIANLDLLPEGVEQPALVSAPAEIAAERYSQELAANFDVYSRARLVKQCFGMLEADYKAYGTLSYTHSHIAFGNSTGIKRYASMNNVNFTALVAHSDGGSGYASINSTNASDFNVAAAFTKAYEKAKLNKNPEDLTPGAYTVVLEPMAVGDLVAYMSYIGFSAKSAQDRMSFLTGKLGEQVFDSRINIVDDYTNENTMSLPFDFEGSPRQIVPIIENGIAKGLVYDLAAALKDGVPSTGHSVNMPKMGGIPLNLVVAGGDSTLEDIIAHTKQGLLVTRFHYMNPVNPREAQLTALTRDGFFRIEDGKIVAAIKNMRFTESMLNAFNNIEAISSDRQRTAFFFGNYFVPGMKIRDFHFTGKASM